MKKEYFCITDQKRFWIVTTKTEVARITGSTYMNVLRHTKKSNVFKIKGFLVGSGIEIITARKGFNR